MTTNHIMSVKEILEFDISQEWPLDKLRFCIHCQYEKEKICDKCLEQPRTKHFWKLKKGLTNKPQKTELNISNASNKLNVFEPKQDKLKTIQQDKLKRKLTGFEL